MGNSDSKDSVISKEALDEYIQLTYLSKNEIRQIYKLFNNLEPGILKRNRYHRFPMEQLDEIFPQIRRSNVGMKCNPFRDAIYRVFSSQRDGCLSFEDTLDLCSVFSANCPEGVRVAWAFEIFDFDEDNQVSLNDLVETVRRLTGLDEHGQIRIDPQQAEDIARIILQEIDLSGTDSISQQEFIHVVSRMPDFAHTFQFKI